MEYFTKDKQCRYNIFLYHIIKLKICNFLSDESLVCYFALMAAAGVHPQPGPNTLSQDKFTVGLEALWQTQTVSLDVFFVIGPLWYKSKKKTFHSEQQRGDSFMFLFELKNVTSLRSLGTKGEFTSCFSKSPQTSNN